MNKKKNIYIYIYIYMLIFRLNNHKGETIKIGRHNLDHKKTVKFDPKHTDNGNRKSTKFQVSRVCNFLKAFQIKFGVLRK